MENFPESKLNSPKPQPQEKQENPVVVITRLAEVAPELQKLAREIVESKKSYDLILSDDASARLVSLFLKKVMDEVQIRRGENKPDIRFVSGGRHDTRIVFEAISNLLKEFDPKHVLLVTEYICSGDSIKKLTKILEDLKIDFDLAVLSSTTSGLKTAKEDVEKKPGQEVFLGSVGPMGLKLYGEGKGQGVVKAGGSYPVFSPVRYKDMTKDNEIKKEIQASVNQSRKDIDVLAKETLSLLSDAI
ncbi:MAG: hypothetical protein UT05_C0001G0039 [Parcubacteria group bacterium GW2011_GWF2_38_76]|nr:MAG: hypothetical protein UT05_C0001G0039 [Parcubacteria group bacterium GW2011_GWF2_38_76]